MIEKILEISSEKLFLHRERGFFEIKKGDEVLRKIPITDISSVLFSGFGQTISTELIDSLIQNNVMLVFCGNGYFPTSFIWPYDSHRYHQKRVSLQVEQSVPFKKGVWKCIVQEKIKNQGQILAKLKNDDCGLIAFAKNVKTGDGENHEAQAARRYWKVLFGPEFVRGDLDNPINSYLNYGYAILRSSVARSICACGLYPSFGVGHSNTENAFCLVDDFIEPYRPVIDQVVYRLIYDIEEKQLNSETKKVLISTLNQTILHDDQSITVSHSILKLCNSYAKMLEEKIGELSFPSKIVINEEE